MPKLLVVDHDRTYRKSLKEFLVEIGYEAAECSDGQAALEMAARDEVDGILLDVAIPPTDGWQILAKLKGNPNTRAIPVIMMTPFLSNEVEATGLRLGAAHVIPKPLRPDSLKLTVRVALREAQRSGDRGRPAPQDEQDTPAAPAETVESKNYVGTGGKVPQLEQMLAGGIPLDSLTLIEGASSTGKTILCQYFLYGALRERRITGYFTAGQTIDGLADEMGSLGLDVSRLISDDNVRPYTLKKPSVDEEPDAQLTALASEIERVPAECNFIIVDDVSNLAQICEDRAVLGFFASCQRVVSAGRTIVVVARSSAFDPRLLVRLNGICNTHIHTGAEKVREQQVCALEVRKVGNRELSSDNELRFQVEPGLGIKILPMARVRV